MNNDLSAYTTITLDRPGLTHHNQAIEHLVSDRLAMLIAWAERRIGLYRLVDPAFGAEDAVQDALFKLWRAAKRGKIHLSETDDQSMKVFLRALEQEILDGRDRERARKRFGAATPADVARVWDVRHVEAEELDRTDPHAPRPDDQVIAIDSVEQSLLLLDTHDPSLRAVAMWLADGCTHREIATRLGRSTFAVKRQVRRIKAILARLTRD
jgi:RNA polymerase sigma factor (sigma-70 family)